MRRWIKVCGRCRFSGSDPLGLLLVVVICTLKKLFICMFNFFVHSYL
jgi:hypothetical protein